MSDVLDHKSDVDIFASSAARRGSETELGTSEDHFFLVRFSPNFGLKIDLCRSDVLFFVPQVFSNRKTATISLYLHKNRPNVWCKLPKQSDVEKVSNLMLIKLTPEATLFLK